MANALTTIFTPPASCFNNYYTTAPLTSSSFFVKDQSILSTGCYPSGYHSLFTQAIPYSPGVCPQRYIGNRAPAWGGNQEATAVVCCPSGFSNDDGLGCFQTLQEDSVIATPGGTTTVSAGVKLAYHGVYVAWASSDLDAFAAGVTPFIGNAPASTTSTTSSSSSTRTSSATPVATLGTTSSTSSSTSSSTQSSTSTSPTPTTFATGTSTSSSASDTTPSLTSTSTTPSPTSTGASTLSAGAKGGIGAGAAVVGAALLGGLAWGVYRRRNRAQNTAPQLQNAAETTPAVSAGWQPGHHKGISDGSYGSSMGQATDDGFVRSELEGSGVHGRGVY